MTENSRVSRSCRLIFVVADPVSGAAEKPLDETQNKSAGPYSMQQASPTLLRHHGSKSLFGISLRVADAVTTCLSSCQLDVGNVFDRITARNHRGSTIQLGGNLDRADTMDMAQNRSGQERFKQVAPLSCVRRLRSAGSFRKISSSFCATAFGTSSTSMSPRFTQERLRRTNRVLVFKVAERVSEHRQQATTTGPGWKPEGWELIEISQQSDHRNRDFFDLPRVCSDFRKRLCTAAVDSHRPGRHAHHAASSQPVWRPRRVLSVRFLNPVPRHHRDGRQSWHQLVNHTRHWQCIHHCENLLSSSNCAQSCAPAGSRYLYRSSR